MSSTRDIGARLLRLAGPVAVARLGIMGMGLADTIMVGQLAPDELAHQAVGWAPTGVLLVGGIGLLTGVQVLSARALGEGAPEKAGAILKRGLVIALIAGFAGAALIWLAAESLLQGFGIAPALAHDAAAVSRILAFSIPLHLIFVAASFFLEGIQRPAAATWIMWAANIANIALNWAFVPEHGAIGSAWATVGARVFLAGGLLIWIWSMRGAHDYGVRASPDLRRGYRPLLAVGVASAIGQIAEAGAFSAMTIIAARLNEQAVATYQILLNLLALMFMVAMGMAAATSVLVSEAIGRKDATGAGRAAWVGLTLNAAIMIALGVVITFASALIARAFTADPVLGASVAGLIWIAALALIPDGSQVVAASALRARGDNWFPTASHIFAYVIIMPPLAYWLAEMQGRGVNGLMEAIFLASVVSIAVLTARLLALNRRAH
jgi:MATE family multidrug resistance protein